MRVVAGSAKGIVLEMPRGAGTRPTSDKVREAVFGVLGDAVVGARVLDLYSGTGALGIEALSRGAAEADLVESRGAACTAIRANLKRARLESRATLWCTTVSRALKKVAGPYDLVTADPPYEDSGIHELMLGLGAGKLLGPGATVVLEHTKRLETAEAYGCLERGTFKRYGDTSVSFYRHHTRGREPQSNTKPQEDRCPSP